jgi:hypothetical protein
MQFPGEPSLSEMLADPIVRAVMARDGVTEEEIEGLFCLRSHSGDKLVRPDPMTCDGLEAQGRDFALGLRQTRLKRGIGNGPYSTYR